MDISSLLPLLLLQNTFSGSGSSGNGMADILKIFGAMNGVNPLFNAFGNLGNSGGMNFGNLFKNNPFSAAFGNNNAGSAGSSDGRSYRNDSGYGNTYNNNTYRDNPSKDNLNAMFPEELLKMLRNLNRKK